MCVCVCVHECVCVCVHACVYVHIVICIQVFHVQISIYVYAHIRLV